MPRAVWPVSRGRPIIEVVLSVAPGGRPVPRQLIADTGAGTLPSGIELLLDEQDCLTCGGTPMQPIVLGGAYVGSYPTYAIQVGIPALAFNQPVIVVGLPTPPTGFDGIACFRFLNRFIYGNFGKSTEFGLEL
ncbi:MAG TPA: hypothetical protein VFI31_20775 [Pirellulales bacterium]|nr:hypothetical protein [Pirellulales bacterium]